MDQAIGAIGEPVWRHAKQQKKQNKLGTWQTIKMCDDEDDELGREEVGDKLKWNERSWRRSRGERKRCLRLFRSFFYAFLSFSRTEKFDFAMRKLRDDDELAGAEANIRKGRQGGGTACGRDKKRKRSGEERKRAPRNKFILLIKPTRQGGGEKCVGGRYGEHKNHWTGRVFENSERVEKEGDKDSWGYIGRVRKHGVE